MIPAGQTSRNWNWTEEREDLSWEPMKVDGVHYRTIWLQEKESAPFVQIIDQRHLPHRFVIEDIRSCQEMCVAIKDMHVRGAGLIGASAGFGMYLAALKAPKDSAEEFGKAMDGAAVALIATRPTAVNLEFAVKRVAIAMQAGSSIDDKLKISLETAQKIADEDADFCKRLGEHGLSIIEKIKASKKEGEAVNILTHCNAGWLAFVDNGSATAPIYAAHDKGIKVHVWVDETRPRNQGASLTAWELGKHGVPHTLIADNVGGHLMQHGMVDMVITGADRVLYTGDVCNKIGTYLKALAAKDNNVPMYVALPSSTFDWEKRDGVKEIPIEARNADELTHIQGLDESTNEIIMVLLCPKGTPGANYAFDVTPARLVTGLITERGVCAADETQVYALFPEKKA